MVSRRETLNGVDQRTAVGRLYKASSPKRATLVFPGDTQDRDWWWNLDTLLLSGEMRSLTDTYKFPVGSIGTLTYWGNSTIRTQISTLRTNMQSTLATSSGRVNLLGVSAGGITALNWAKNNLDKVHSIVLLIPVLDVQAIYDVPRSVTFKNEISAAYGGRPGDSDNPIKYASQLNGIPISVYYSTNDTVTTQAESEAFILASGAEGNSMGAVGHFWGSPWNANAAGAFFEEHDSDTVTVTPPPTESYKGFAVGGVFQSETTATINQDLDDMVALGAKWIRTDINWAQIQGGGSTSYNWTSDYVISAAIARGLKVLAGILYSPWWHGPNAPAGNANDPPNPTTYANFCATAVNRYKTWGVHHYEVWNEPNITGFWNPVSPVTYTNVLKAAYPAIKAADPSAVVLHGGLASAPDSGGQMSITTFFQQMYVNGAKGYFDAGNVHPYTQPSVPGGGEDWNPWTHMTNMRTSMVNRLEGAKQIWITESGAATSGDPAQPGTYTTEAAQSNIISLGFSQAKALGYVGPIFVYMHRDRQVYPGTAIKTREEYFGVRKFDRSLKPSATTFLNADYSF